MGFGMIALALAAAQQADVPPPTMVNMVAPAAIEGAPLRQPQGDGFLCSAGFGDCVRIVREENGSMALAVFDMDAAATDIDMIALPAQLSAGSDPTDDRQQVRLWDRAVQLANSEYASSGARTYLIGVIRSTAISFSGGGAGADRLHLFRLTIADGAAELGSEILSIPWTADTLVRACFSEEDRARRREECHDRYRYSAALALTPERNGLLPSLSYMTVATAFPRTSRRSEDNSAAPPLTAADLVEWRDSECSYARTLAYNPATERYEMDRPAPDCSSYTVP